MRGLERDRQLTLEAVGAQRDAARHHELPQPEIPETQRIEPAVFLERWPDVDLVVDAVGLLLLEVVRRHALRRLLLEVEVRRHRLRDPRDALLEPPPLGVHGAEPRIERGAVGLDALAHRAGPNDVQVLEQRLDFGAEERGDADLVARSEPTGRSDPGDRRRRYRSSSSAGSAPLTSAPPTTSRARRSCVEQVRLDRERPLGRRAANVGERVERIASARTRSRPSRSSVIVRAVPGVALDAFEHRAPEAPLHRRVDGRALLLDDRLHAVVQLVHAALHGDGEQRQHLPELGQARRIQVAGHAASRARACR